MSSQSCSGVGSVLYASTPVASTIVSMYRLSSNRISVKTDENVFCRAPTLAGASSRISLLMRTVRVEESIPPERQVPTGTSLLRWIRVALTRMSRSRDAASAS